MGYGANFADTIEETTIRDICKIEIEALEKALAANNSNLEKYAQELVWGEEVAEEVEKAYERLQEVFEIITYGLTLILNYHNSDDGDRYDDVNGYFWEVGEVYKMTDAGRRMQEKIERKYFVQYG